MWSGAALEPCPRAASPNSYSQRQEENSMRSTKIRIGVACAAACLLALATAALAFGGGTSRTATAKVGTGAAGISKCGLGNGKKATGAPIKLGGIAMLIPGVDFTTIGKV